MAQPIQRICVLKLVTVAAFAISFQASGNTFSISVQGQQTTLSSGDRVHGYRYASTSNCSITSGASVQCVSTIDIVTPVSNDRNPSPNVGCVRSPILVWNSATSAYSTTGDRIALRLNCPANTQFTYASTVPINVNTPGLVLIDASALAAPITALIEVTACRSSSACDTLIWAVPVANTASPVTAPSNCSIAVARTTLDVSESQSVSLFGCNGATGATVIWYLDGRAVATGSNATVTPFLGTTAQARSLLQADVCIAGACQATAAQVMFALQGAPATSGCFDLDGDGRHLAATDGVMLTRAMLGFTGAAITMNAIASGAQRTDWTVIRQHLLNCGAPWVQ